MNVLKKMIITESEIPKWPWMIITVHEYQRRKQKIKIKIKQDNATIFASVIIASVTFRKKFIKLVRLHFLYPSVFNHPMVFLPTMSIYSTILVFLEDKKWWLGARDNPMTHAYGFSAWTAVHVRGKWGRKLWACDRAARWGKESPHWL